MDQIRKSLVPIFSSFVLTLVVSCARPPANQGPDLPDSGIVHGRVVSGKDRLAKTVVALVSETDQGQALCTGSLLDNETVLTAAHCVDHDPNALWVVFGANLKNSQIEKRPVDRYLQNPGWGAASADGRGDLALIHFSGGLADGFQPVQLASSILKLDAGVVVKMIGYGVNRGETQAGSGRLRQTETTVLQQASPTEVLTDGRSSSVCFGDSGGPAFVKTEEGFVQWGVASSVTASDCREASIHTSVMNYENWIRSATRNLKHTPL